MALVDNIICFQQLIKNKSYDTANQFWNHNRLCNIKYDNWNGILNWILEIPNLEIKQLKIILELNTNKDCMDVNDSECIDNVFKYQLNNPNISEFIKLLLTYGYEYNTNNNYYIYKSLYSYDIIKVLSTHLENNTKLITGLNISNILSILAEVIPVNEYTKKQFKNTFKFIINSINQEYYYYNTKVMINKSCINGNIYAVKCICRYLCKNNLVDINQIIRNLTMVNHPEFNNNVLKEVMQLLSEYKHKYECN